MIGNVHFSDEDNKRFGNVVNHRCWQLAAVIGELASLIDDDDALLLCEIINCLCVKGEKERERREGEGEGGRESSAKLILSTEKEDCMYDMISGS